MGSEMCIRDCVRGADVADSDPVTLRRSIGYVMQHSGLMPHRTALDNVADIAKLSGAGKGEAKRRAADMLELVNLGSSLFGRYPAELSGGQAQRVGVARGMVTLPNATRSASTSTARRIVPISPAMI